MNFVHDIVLPNKYLSHLSSKTHLYAKSYAYMSSLRIFWEGSLRILHPVSPLCPRWGVQQLWLDQANQ